MIEQIKSVTKSAVDKVEEEKAEVKKALSSFSPTKPKEKEKDGGDGKGHLNVKLMNQLFNKQLNEKILDSSSESCDSDWERLA